MIHDLGIKTSRGKLYPKGVEHSPAQPVLAFLQNLLSMVGLDFFIYYASVYAATFNDAATLLNR